MLAAGLKFDITMPNDRVVLVRKKPFSLVLTVVTTWWIVSAIAQTNYQQLARFGTSSALGANPVAPLIPGADGAMLGVSSSGGPAGIGGVFHVGTNGESHAALHYFGRFALDRSKSLAAVVTGPDGSIYGTTQAGGGAGGGSIFKLSTNGNFTILHEFGSIQHDGGNVVSGLAVGADGTLFGTTASGGQSNSGTIYKLNPDGGGYAILHHFGSDSLDGLSPLATPLLERDGRIYGTTIDGGAFNTFAGTIYSINTDGSNYKVLHSFSFGEGYNPQAGLAQAADDGVYGVTSYGGDFDGGLLFRYSPSETNYSPIFSFERAAGGKIGANVQPSGVVPTADGWLYGTTAYGGIANSTSTNGFGSVFKIRTNGTSYTILRQFSGPDGRNPSGAPFVSADGTLYGTTLYGGKFDGGTVFKLGTAPFETVAAIDTSSASDGIHVTFSGAIQQSYIFETSSKLESIDGWQGLVMASSDQNGLIEFVDPNATNGMSRYYRVTIPFR